MDFHQLKVFHAAVRTSGFTLASRELNLSQSTVSQHIKQLEEESPCQLFVRVGKRVVLTKAGEILREHCEKIFQACQNAELAIRELSGLTKGRVRFGTGATTLIYQLPPVLETYRTRFPQVELIVVSEITDNILRDIHANRLDLGLVMLPVEENDLLVSPLCDEEVWLAIPSSHLLARKRALRVDDLRQLRFILYERKTVMRKFIDDYFAKLGIVPDIVMVVENIEAIKSLVGAGLGASALPIHAVGDNVADKKVRLMRVEKNPLFRQLGMVTLKSSYIPAPVRELHQLITDQLTTRSSRPIRTVKPGGK